MQQYYTKDIGCLEYDDARNAHGFNLMGVHYMFYFKLSDVLKNFAHFRHEYPEIRNVKVMNYLHRKKVFFHLQYFLY